MQMGGLIVQSQLAKRGKLLQNTFVSFGSPYIDIIANVDEKFLSKYKLQPNTTTQATDDHGKLFEELPDCDSYFQAGGSTTNTARVLQWIAPFQGTSCHIGCIGEDDDGVLLQKVLKKEQVHFMPEIVKYAETGRCATLLCKESITLVKDPGASRFLSINFLEQKDVLKVLHKAKYFYMSGQFFGVSLPIVATISKLATEKDKTFILHIADVALCKKFTNEFLNLYPRIHILFGNEDEVRGLAHLLNIKEEKLNDIIVQVATYSRTYPQERLVVTTRQTLPIVVALGQQIKEYQIEHLKESEIKDKSCAGDAFIGGFMAKYIEDRSIDDCVNCGIFTAREVIRHVGCNFNAVKRFL